MYNYFSFGIMFQIFNRKGENMSTKIITGDSLQVLRTIADESVHCVITSPPYYGLRDYGTGTWEGGDPSCPHYRTTKKSETTATGHKHMQEIGEPVGDAIYKTVCPLCGAVRVDNQMGLEATPEEYIAKMVELFREVRRVLKKDGTLWLNIGDSYAGRAGRWGGNKNMSAKQTSNNGSVGQIQVASKWHHDEIKPKDLIGIPWMLAFALRADGWYLRQDIIWQKPNPMPESVRDRCTKSHEYIFLLSKSPKYYFDYEAIKEPCSESNIKDFMRRKRDVWSIATKPFKGAHFATFPEDLVLPCLLAGCPEEGTALDTFAGAGTVGVVCKKNNRNFIGIELNPEYAAMAESRIENTEDADDGQIKRQISMF